MNPIQIALSILGITIIRTFLENFSNPEPVGGFTSFALLHGYFLFYAVVVVSVGIIMGLVLKESWMKHISRATYFLPIIWIAPIIDLLVSGGACMSYIGTTGGTLVRDLVTFFGPLPEYCGITLGIRIEIAIIMIATGWYVWKKTKVIWKTITALLLVYGAIFFHLALPGIIRSFGDTSLGINQFFSQMFSQSLMGTIHTFIGTAGLPRFFEGIALLGGRIPWIILIILITITAWQEAPKKFFAWMHNVRLERIIYYLLITTAGFVFAVKTFDVTIPLTFLDIIAYIIVATSVILGWWLAVALNDIEDESIDQVSNPHRPLIAGSLSQDDLKSIAFVSGIFLTSGALLINWNVFMSLAVFQIAYTIYSLSPLRMKKHFISSSLLVGLAGLGAFFAGYFLIAPDQSFTAVMYGVFIAVLGTLAIMSNTKDFKDIAGDTAEGMKTMPVVFGAKRAGKYLTWTLIIWILYLGMIYSSIWIALQAIPWIILDVIWKKRVPEYVRFVIVCMQFVLLMVVL